MSVYTTACPRNCYSTCGMRVHVEDGEIRRIEPHAGNRATPEGVCLKGLSYVERVRSPDRVLTPLRRTPSGDFQPVDWDAALDLIAGELRRLRATTGPQGLLYYAGSGTKGLLNAAGLEFWRLYGGCTTTYGDLCWPAGLEATRLTLGDNRHSVPWDIARARLIVMWGKNAAETNIHQMPFIQEAREAGGRLVVIDPRRTESTDSADLWLRPRPGSDGALALALAGEIIRSNSIDETFVRDHVNGFEEFAALAGDCSLDWASEITEVPVSQILELAGWMGSVRPMSITAGYGMQRYTNSGQTIRAILALLAITGNFGRPGAGWVYANLQSHIFDEVRDPLACYPPEEPDGVVRVSVSTARLGRDILDQAAPPIRMAWVERGNPVTQNPDTKVVLEAFRALDFRVVVDQFLTDTAREADLVLPAKTMFEQTDVIGAYWHPYLQLRQKIVEPPGLVKPETEVYRLLAPRLGVDLSRLAGKIPGPSDADVESFLEARLAPFDGLSIERLKEGPALPPLHEEIAYATGRFSTPSGRIELVSDEAHERWGVDRLPCYTEPQESVRRAVGRPEYPLYLMTPNTKNRIHSQFGNLRMIRRVDPGPAVHVHPDDARPRGIEGKARVRVFNDRGEFRLPAKIDSGLKPGCISVTNGWWIQEGGTVNFCSPGRETDMGHGAAFHDTLVEIETA
ncbi:MAG: molybdopterin-dependent oxidoreductase [Gemmatimonadetes bacterium]|nr:molybdopterin-dependent oxidoreductase [Gemmatimonadota bacterium]NNK48951.1 molybdopterin-dependent oxidoreductase [Gemmatimonadota bacterium]